MPILQIFAHRYRLGSLAPSGSPVKARTVEAALRAVGQTFSILGQADPRLIASGKLDFRLQRQLQYYNKLDPPPTRVKPIPLQIIQAVVTFCYTSTSPDAHAVAHMLLLGFFFLLRPGEYAYTTNPDAAPFRICDIHLIAHNRRLNIQTCSDQDLHAAAFVALEFTTQKNGVRGEPGAVGPPHPMPGPSYDRTAQALTPPQCTPVPAHLFRMHTSGMALHTNNLINGLSPQRIIFLPGKFRRQPSGHFRALPSG